MSGPFTAAVVIPARNEARRLPACLTALLPQIGGDILVVVVANNCTDATAEVARAALPGPGLAVIDCTLDPAQGVGEARRRGCAHAMTHCPDIAHLLTTDADCIPAPDWIARNRAHLGEVDGVCGLVEPLPGERGVLRQMSLRASNRKLPIATWSCGSTICSRPNRTIPIPTTAARPGASLACRTTALRRVGNFSDLRTGEDRDLIRRMRADGLRLRHAGDVLVQTSCRPKGRAQGGWADTLRHRLAEPDFPVDEALPPVAWLLDMAGRGRLAAWPPHLPERDRLHRHDLPREIALLGRVLARLTSAQGPSTSSPSISSTRNPDHDPILPSSALLETRLRYLAHERRGAGDHNGAHGRNGRPLDAGARRDHANGMREVRGAREFYDARGNESAARPAPGPGDARRAGSGAAHVLGQFAPLGEVDAAADVRMEQFEFPLTDKA